MGSVCPGCTGLWVRESRVSFLLPHPDTLAPQPQFQGSLSSVGCQELMSPSKWPGGPFQMALAQSLVVD